MLKLKLSHIVPWKCIINFFEPYTDQKIFDEKGHKITS